MATKKAFRRVYLTVDKDVMTALGLDAETVTSTQLRKRLRQLFVSDKKASAKEDKKSQYGPGSHYDRHMGSGFNSP